MKKEKKKITNLTIYIELSFNNNHKNKNKNLKTITIKKKRQTRGGEGRKKNPVNAFWKSVKSEHFVSWRKGGGRGGKISSPGFLGDRERVLAGGEIIRYRGSGFWPTNLTLHHGNHLSRRGKGGWVGGGRQTIIHVFRGDLSPNGYILLARQTIFRRGVFFPACATGWRVLFFFPYFSRNLSL